MMMKNLQVLSKIKKDDNNSNLSEMSNLAGQMQASSMQDKMLTKKDG